MISNINNMISTIALMIITIAQVLESQGVDKILDP
jgi:hypothetical protein